MNTVIYSTETPIIAPAARSFDYATKRSAYVDCCYALLDLNRVCKELPDNYRHYIYRLKNRWIEMLYRKGFCVQAYEDRRILYLKFKVDGIVFAWHIPEKALTFQVEEKRVPVWYEYVKDLPRRTKPLAECIALLESSTP